MSRKSGDTNSDQLSEDVSLSVNGADNQLLHDLQVHQIELEMQNEQLRQAQQALEESRDRYVDLYEFAPLGYLTLDRYGIIEEANLTAAVMLGEDRKTLKGARFTQFVIAEECNRWGRLFSRMLQLDQAEPCELILQQKNGVSLYVQVHSIRVLNNRKPSLRISLTNITEKKGAEAEIMRLAYFDHLTNLPNRMLLRDRLSQSLASAERNRQFGAILFLDLDNFKLLNDTRGHDVGDKFLVETAKQLLSSVRASDTVARWGGDEFVIVLDALSTDSIEAASQATQLGETVREKLNRPFTLREGVFHSAASIGVTLFCGNELVDDLLKQADLAMYQAKNRGGNTLSFFNPTMQADLIKRSAAVIELRHAIQEHQFQLYFQPQIDCNGQITSAESLLRWFHEDRGLVLPEEFIALAEETGLILPIGQWVLLTACMQLKYWQKSPMTQKLHLTINVSAQEFRQPKFVDQVTQIIHSTGIDPTLLKIELTESQLIRNIEETLEKMNQLRGLGIRFSMDDFGTGYSSLASLMKLPFDEIKIDKSFVQNLDPHGQVVLQTIINMASNLGLNVIAEGVETETQRDFLLKNKCPSLQGNLFSLPLSAEEFDSYIQRVPVS